MKSGVGRRDPGFSPSFYSSGEFTFRLPYSVPYDERKGKTVSFTVPSVSSGLAE